MHSNAHVPTKFTLTSLHVYVQIICMFVEAHAVIGLAKTLAGPTSDLGTPLYKCLCLLPLQLNPAASLTKKVMYDLFKQDPSHCPMRDEWRCVTIGCGVQSVLTPSPPPGMRQMLRWCVDSWDSVEPSTPYYKIRESIALECGLA